MPRILTAADIEAVVAGGARELILDDATRLTDWAAETARRLGLRLLAGPGVVAPWWAEPLPSRDAARPPEGAAGDLSPSSATRLAPPADGPSGPRQAAAKPVEIGPGAGGGLARDGAVPLVAATADLAIRRARCVIPGLGELQADIAVRGGQIVSLDRSAWRTARQEIQADGLYAFPGLVDPHVHLGLFAPLEEEMATESLAALQGGVTTVGVMVITRESLLSALPRWIRLANARSWADVVLHPAVVTEEQLEELPQVARRFAVTSYKAFMAGIEGVTFWTDDGFLWSLARRVRELGVGSTLLVHCENMDLLRRAGAAVQASSPRAAGLPEWEHARPELAEAVAIRTAGQIAEAAGVPLYLVHVTSAVGLQAALEVRARHPPTFIETESTYLTHDWTSPLGALAKMVPPLRGPESRHRLWAAIQEGEVDVIGTDHVCLTREQKRAEAGMWEAIPGCAQLAVHLAALLEEGVHRRGVNVARVVECASQRPAQILGLYPRKGTLLPGADADICLVDLARPRRVDAADLLGRTDFTLYDGQTLRGWPVWTIKGGVPAVQDGRPRGSRPTGQYLARRSEG